MLGQAVITIPVMDGAFFLPHVTGMLTHDEIREELIRQIDGGKVKQAQVARWLNIAPARIAEVRKGDRRIQQDEMPVLAEKLGMAEPAARLGERIDEVAEIPNWGKVAQGVWMEQTDLEQRETVPYDRMRGDPPPIDLFAVTPEGVSMNLRFMPDSRLICRRIPFGVGTVAPGDYVIVARHNHDLRELTCKRIEIDDDGVFWLYSESSDPKFAEPWRIGRPSTDQYDDEEIQIIGKVIRAVQDFENGKRRG